MTAATQDIKTDKVGSLDIPPPPLLGLPMAANVIVYGGTFGASDASGRCTPATSSSALFIWGIVDRQINNLNTNTPFGAAGAQNVLIRPGAYYCTSDGTVTAAMIGQPVYALDDNTITTNPTKTGVTYWLPYVGQVIPPGLGDFGFTPTDSTKVPVYIGEGGPTQVLKATVNFPLATLQGFTSTVAFNVGPVMPANARLIGAEINIITALAGNTSDTITVQGGSDAAGTILASTNIFTGTGTSTALPGSNPYQNRGGQQIKATITGGSALSGLTAGSISIDLFYTILQ